MIGQKLGHVAVAQMFRNVPQALRRHAYARDRGFDDCLGLVTCDSNLFRHEPNATFRKNSKAPKDALATGRKRVSKFDRCDVDAIQLAVGLWQGQISCVQMREVILGIDVSEGPFVGR